MRTANGQVPLIYAPQGSFASIVRSSDLGSSSFARPRPGRRPVRESLIANERTRQQTEQIQCGTAIAAAATRT